MTIVRLPHVTLLACCAGIGLAAPLALGEVITTAEGERLEGSVVAVSAEHVDVLVQDAPEPRRIALEEVQSITVFPRVFTMKPTGADVVAAAAMVGHWRFDDADPAVAHDGSGRGHHGRVVGAARVPGRLGQALQFTGRNSYVELPKGIASSAAGSVAMWIQTQTQANRERMLFFGFGGEPHITMSNGFGSQPDLHLHLHREGVIEGFIQHGQQQIRPKGQVACVDGQWHHVAMTWEHGQTVRVFVDGVLAAAEPYPADAPPFELSNGMRLAGPAAAERLYAGLMEDVRLFNKALAETEIRILAGLPSGGGGGAAPPMASKPWRIQWHNDDQITARITAWSDAAVTVHVDAAQATVDIPLRSVRLFVRPGAKTDWLRGVRTEAAEDSVFVQKDASVQELRGVVLGVRDDALNFRFEEQDRQIALDRIVGIVLAGAAVADDGRLRQTFVLHNADRITGTWTGIDEESITLRLPWNASIRIPRGMLATMHTRNGRLIHLSDLTPAQVEQVPYFDRVMPYQIDRAFGGGKLKLLDGEYTRGIAVHARTVLTYEIGGGYEKFQAKMGFQQPEGRIGRAVVRVLGDGRTLYENADARGDQKPVALELDVRGVKSLALEVDFGAMEDVGDRVVWAEPRLIRVQGAK